MDMRFYWIQYQIKKYFFHVLRNSGTENLGDYLTNYPQPHHHRKVRPIQIHPEATTDTDSARVCSLLEAIENIGNFNMSAIPKNDRKVTPKSQSTQR